MFTLVFAYIGGFHLFLRKEPFTVRLAIYVLFVISFVFLLMFLYSASLFGQEWLDLRQQSEIGDGLQGYSGYSVNLMRIFGGIIGVATIAFVSIETFRTRK